MDCKQAREYFLDLLAESAARPAVAGLEEHLRACTACAAELESLRRTHALLGEWTAPEPSAYFDTRLRARLREEAAVSPGWWAWLRKPALAAAFALLLAVGVNLFRSAPPAGMTAANHSAQAPQIGSAVSDLQQLDQNQDLYANFDVLDDLAPQTQTENP